MGKSGGLTGEDRAGERPWYRPEWRATLAARLLGWFLVIAFLPGTAVAYLANGAARAALTKQVWTQLEEVAQSKAERIEAYARERRRRVSAVARSPGTVRVFLELLQAEKNHGLPSDELEAASNRARAWLRPFVEELSFKNLLFVSSAGDVVFALEPHPSVGTNYHTGAFRGTEFAKVAERARMVMETEFSDFAQQPGGSEPAAFLAAPMVAEGVIVGVAVLELSNREVYDYVNDYHGLGETGEIVIGSRVGNDVVFVTPVRHDPNAAFQRKVSADSAWEEPLLAAVRGIRGSGQVTDYRGHRTLAVWRYVPSLRWGLVVKLDTSEALAPVEEQRGLVLLFASAPLALAGLAAAFVARSIAVPLTTLTGVVRQIAAGDLNQRVAVSSRDEIGELGSSFNQMAENLRTTYATIEQKVEHRTRELLEANSALEREVLERKRTELLLTEKLDIIQAQKEAIRALSTPILQVWDGVLALPVIGVIDQARAAQMMADLLAVIHDRNVRFTILDLTGVEAIDSEAVSYLLKLARAVTLLGSGCIISGISAKMAGAIVDFNIEIEGLLSFSTLKAALHYALRDDLATNIPGLHRFSVRRVDCGD